jgi:hypothetical protein
VPHDALFAEIVDDAKILAPSTTSMSDALDSHRMHRQHRYSEVLGLFVVPASRIDELRAATHANDYLRVSLLGDSDLSKLREARAAVMDDPWIEIVQLEVALPVGLPVDAAMHIALDELNFTAPTCIEVPRNGFEAALDVLAADGAERAQYRTGGAAQSDVPESGELAAFISGCARRRVSFKLTGGLQQAVRGIDPASGRDLHGVLNVLVATDRALAGAPIEQVTAALELRDASVLVSAINDVNPQVRDLLRSLDCADIANLVDDLTALGMLSNQ